MTPTKSAITITHANSVSIAPAAANIGAAIRIAPTIKATTIAPIASMMLPVVRITTFTTLNYPSITIL